MSDWNFADIWETVASVRPESTAIIQGDHHLRWREFDIRANGIASALLAAGLARQSKVAQYLHNGPPYLESILAAFKASMVPVNTNYRYTEDELLYLWHNADVEAVIFDDEFSDRIEGLRHRLPGIRSWLWVDRPAGGGTCPGWATPYEAAASSGARRVHTPWSRSGDDLILIYTGGTTGMPKGVMWRQDDLFSILNRSADVRYPEAGGVDDVSAALLAPARHGPPRLLPGPPLMHGTGLFTAMAALSSGGAIVLTTDRHFSASGLLDTVERHRVTSMAIVGDAFAKPILAALDAEPGRWDLSSLWLIVSSGVMWSAEVKAGLLRHHPGLLMVDALGSSEAVGVAQSLSSAKGTAGTGGFVLGADTRIIAADGRDVVAGSGDSGLVALRGRGPIGYYNDPEKSASTFRLIAGERWTVPGDFASVDADGVVKLLGRGSVCINTGGEKVFPEEVEEALKAHSAVADAVVVGVPDERFGEMVVALVEPAPGAEVFGDDLIEWVKHRLAGYKSPRRIIEIATVGRAPNGKVDYRRHKAHATDVCGAGASTS